MKKKDIKYVVRFVNESRTTIKYKIAKDVSRAIKQLEKSCDKLSSENNKTTLQNISRKFKERASILYDNNFSSIPICDTESTINQEKYNIYLMLNYSKQLSVRANVNKKTKMIFIMIFCPSIDDLIEIIDNDLLFRFIKEDLNHEFAHIYDNDSLGNNHYSDLKNFPKSPIYFMYYLSSPDEVKSFCQEVFYALKNKNDDNETGIEILNSIIRGYLNNDDILSNLTLRLMVSQIKNNKSTFNRYYSMFLPNSLRLFSKEKVDKIREMMFSSIRNDTWKELLDDEKFISL